MVPGRGRRTTSRPRYPSVRTRTGVRLSQDLGSGTVVAELTGDTDVPTTIARFGGSVYVVNAAFRPPDAPLATEFWVTRIGD